MGELSSLAKHSTTLRLSSRMAVSYSLMLRNGLQGKTYGGSHQLPVLCCNFCLRICSDTTTDFGSEP